METRKMAAIKNFNLSASRTSDRYTLEFNNGKFEFIYLSLSELLKLFIAEGLSMEEIIVLWEKDRSILFKKATIYLNRDDQNGKHYYAGSDVSGVYWERARKSYLHEIDVELLDKIITADLFQILT